MNNLNFKVGVKEENLVHRKLQLIGITQYNHADISQEMNKVFAIEKLNIEVISGMLSISYDATNSNLTKIQNLLSKYQVRIKPTYWNRIKLHYYQFVDQNILEQKFYKAVCCHKAPVLPKK
ncbi:cation transporter [Psychromonas sp. RZ22]|uniref:cation transporter n=1 Tax=Psychromonas algarum TaxID=2555643 RepID=UPI00106842B1|nr:cation transporter [Psychromonas sp. RZ22]TEW54702.1 cation transporter [Psychromonas sp. RZ22]